jgi:hypothetical protein
MMTDEQYIDWLFKQTARGYENTPGFRAFLLQLMAPAPSEERPNACEVASMHVAYTAGQEQAGARVWTDERPTEAGEYWVSISPSKRTNELAHFSWPLRVSVTAKMCGLRGLYFLLTEEVFDGAKWSRRETPADPFEVTT